MATFNYIYKNDKTGELVVEEFDVNANDIQALDVEGYYDNKNLEDILETLGEANRLYLVENEEQIKKGKAGIYFCDDILDNREDNNVVKRIKDYLNSIVGDLSNLKTNDKTNLVNAINENTSYLKDYAKDIKNLDDNKIELKKVKNIQCDTLCTYGEFIVENIFDGKVATGEQNYSLGYPQEPGFLSLTVKPNMINCNANGVSYIATVRDSGHTFIKYQLNGTVSKWKQLATTESSSVELKNNWDSFAGFLEPSVTKTGKTITISGRIQGGITTNGTIFGNIPIGFRPSLPVKGFINNVLKLGEFNVTQDGNMSFTGISSGVLTNDSITFFATYNI